jgi:hypothetical protein
MQVGLKASDPCHRTSVNSTAASRLTQGQLVGVRTRNWLVDDVLPSAHGTWLRLACVDDDAQGETLEVIWEAELDGKVLDGEAWARIGSKGFDPPRHFASYFNTLRWQCVTATDPKLFQSPCRAGIRITD